MQITTDHYKHCDLIKATGQIDEHTVPLLAEAFEASHRAGRFKIVFDMSGVEFVSSAGLRVMIKGQQACKRWNRGELLLAGVSEQVHRTLSLVGLTSLFRFFDDVTEAVGSF